MMMGTSGEMEPSLEETKPISSVPYGRQAISSPLAVSVAFFDKSTSMSSPVALGALENLGLVCSPRKGPSSIHTPMPEH
jgi:hypothetical protein